MENKLIWKAVYKNGDIFPQFDKNGRENLFGDINYSKLKSFSLIDQFNSEIFKIDLIDRVLFVRHVGFSISDELINLRLIYFKRVRQIFDTSYGMRTEIDYHVGIQGNIDEKNKKLVLIIKNNGGFQWEI